MAYIGKTPVIGNFVKLDSITVVNGQAAYTMQNGGVNFTSYDNVNQFLVSLNGVLQAPTDSFTVSGSTLTFASNLSTGDVIDFVMVLGNSLNVGTPSDNTISTAKLQDNAITSAKLASGAVQNQSAFKNIIINGDMSICQRATSVANLGNSLAGYQVQDRWKLKEQGSESFEFTMSKDTDVPTGQGFASSLKLDCTTADNSIASSGSLRIQQFVEGQNLQYLKKGTSSAESLTCSFWIKSTKTGTYILELYDSDNTRQISKSYTVSASNTWEKKTITFDGDTSGAFNNDNAASLELNFWLVAGSNYSSGTLNTSWNSVTAANRAVGQVNISDSTSNEWYITGVQLEAGTSASDFEFLPTDVNLQRCLRYYFELGVSDSKLSNTGIAFNTGEFNTNLSYPVFMRATPTLTFYDNAGNSARVHRSGVGDHANAVSPVNYNEKKLATVSSTSLTSGGGYAFRLEGTAEL